MAMDELEQRVWQRVLAQRELPQERSELKLLMLEAMERKNILYRIFGVASGKQKKLLSKLLAGEEETIACLRGMCRLAGVDTGKEKAVSARKEQPRKLLQQCYYRSCRAMAEYTARSAESEFGVIFLKMAERQRTLCAMVAELLGQWESKDKMGKR